MPRVAANGRVGINGFAAPLAQWPSSITSSTLYWGRSSYVTSSPASALPNLGSASDTPTAIGSQRPTLVTVGGRAALRFDGSDDRLLFPTNITATNITMFVVCARISGSGDLALLSLSNPAIYMTLGGTEWGVYANGNVLSGYSLDTNAHILTAVVRAANDIDLYTDGGNKVTRTNGAGFPGRGASAIGADATGVQSSNVDLFELGIVNGSVSAADLLIIHAYFSAWYGITLAP
jgi:hypothetical protein